MIDEIPVTNRIAARPPSGRGVVRACLTLFVFAFFGMLRAQDYTRGVGIYPGDPNEDFSPVLRADRATYRNLALCRPAAHSSSRDYNLTAQLVTDGIIHTEMPALVVTSTSLQEILPKNEQNRIIDHHIMTAVDFTGPSGWVQIEMRQFKNVPVFDRLNVQARLTTDDRPPEGWECVAWGSDDGLSWNELGRAHGPGLPGDSLPRFFRRLAPRNMRVFSDSIDLRVPSAHRFYRIGFNAPNVMTWNVGGVDFFTRGNLVDLAPLRRFTSAWWSSGNGEEWVSIDLGKDCTF
ncbi:MAG TPA: hypothetical protein VGB38_07280, partial [bacterium]